MTNEWRSSNFGFGAVWTPTHTPREGSDWSDEKWRTDLRADLFNVSSGSLGCDGQLTLRS